MENQLIQIYLFVCHIYDTSPATCFQRLSNNREPSFTDQELITIWFFAHLSGFTQKKQMHLFIKNYWFDWFPRLPAYQTFVYRLNLLEPSFQTFGKILFALPERNSSVPEADQIIDSLPVMLAAHGHSYGGACCPRASERWVLRRQENTLSRRSLALDRPAAVRTLAAAFCRLVSRSRRSRLQSGQRACRPLSLPMLCSATSPIWIKN